MKEFKPVKTALIGCGAISSHYLNNCKRLKIFDLIGCSDIKPERSLAKANEYGIKQMTNEEIYADPEIELVINTTFPLAHYEVTKNALLAGKNVHSEKMMGISFAEGLELTALAQSKGLLFGCAPDTFLGAGLQTARRVLDAGLIGEPFAANALLVRSYHQERASVNVEKSFVFHEGAGIIFDVGCYYLTALVNLLGPINRVSGFAQTRGANDRVYMNPSSPYYGEVMTIESTNLTAGAMEFKQGTLCTILTSSEGAGVTTRFAVFGDEGTLDLGDPNEFGSPVTVKSKTGAEMVMPVNHAFSDNGWRCIGAADLAYALRNGRKPRASGESALHTLEAAWGIVNGGVYSMTTTCERAEPLKAGYVEYPEMVFDI